MISILGDSFCGEPDGWPGMLADMLGQELFCRGHGGEAWYRTALDLQKYKNQIKQSDIIVFVHTGEQRITAEEENIYLADHSNLDTSREDQLAISLYYKYIHNEKFFDLVHTHWFEHLSKCFNDKQVIHLHSFRSSIEKGKKIFGDCNVEPSLTSISLNELGRDVSSLVGDFGKNGRLNHFNKKNNAVLAEQIYAIITGKQQNIDPEKFELQTRYWDNKY